MQIQLFLTVIRWNGKFSMAGTLKKDFDEKLNQKTGLVNSILKQVLADQLMLNPDLLEAVKYTLDAPGKRIRSALVLWCCEIISGRINPDAEVSAAAIEMVHTYSLVHDDLPAMDNDDFRRGQPSCHKAFDEATAILVGDALLTIAFEILAKKISDPVIAVKLISQLAQDSGPAGMIAGQMADINAERVGGNDALLEEIHINKTAKMFRCAAAMGAICGGANKSEFDCLCEYGLKIGLGFQIADDILDVCGLTENLGKTAGKDDKLDKCTYPKVFGVEKSKELEKKLTGEAVSLLDRFGLKADILRQLALALSERKR
jgi:geranylgeranyl diphosphate synthase type II